MKWLSTACLAQLFTHALMFPRCTGSHWDSTAHRPHYHSFLSLKYIDLGPATNLLKGTHMKHIQVWTCTHLCKCHILKKNKKTGQQAKRMAMRKIGNAPSDALELPCLSCFCFIEWQITLLAAQVNLIKILLKSICVVFQTFLFNRRLPAFYKVVNGIKKTCFRWSTPLTQSWPLLSTTYHISI